MVPLGEAKVNRNTTDAKIGHQTVFSILQSRDHNSLLLLIHFALSLFLTVELMILKSKLQIECTIALQLQVQQQQKQCTPLLDLLSRCALTYKCDCHFITREEVFALVCPTGLLLNHNGAIPFRFT